VENGGWLPKKKEQMRLGSGYVLEEAGAAVAGYVKEPR